MSYCPTALSSQCDYLPAGKNLWVGYNTQGIRYFPGHNGIIEKTRQPHSITRLKNYFQDIRRLARDSTDFTRDPSRNHRKLGPSGSLSLPPYTLEILSTQGSGGRTVCCNSTVTVIIILRIYYSTQGVFNSSGNPKSSYFPMVIGEPLTLQYSQLTFQLQQRVSTGFRVQSSLLLLRE